MPDQWTTHKLLGDDVPQAHSSVFAGGSYGFAVRTVRHRIKAGGRTEQPTHASGRAGLGLAQELVGVDVPHAHGVVDAGGG